MWLEYGIRRRNPPPVRPPARPLEVVDATLALQMWEYNRWLGQPQDAPTPAFLAELLSNFRLPHPGERTAVKVFDGGGPRINAVVPGLAVATQVRPHAIFASSAGTFSAAAMMQAESSDDVAKTVKAVTGVPYGELFATEERRYKLPLASAKPLEEWDRHRTGDVKVNEFLFKEGPPVGLEGFHHRLQVTVCVTVVDRKDVPRLRVGDIAPGEQKEICFWDAAVANYRSRYGRSTMRQYLFPRDLFSHDAANPHALGPLGKLLKHVIGGEDDQAVLKWLATQSQATWNAHSCRTPFAMKAMAIGLPDGSALVIADGQTLGPPPLIAPKEQPVAAVSAARTMIRDVRRPYKDRPAIAEIDLSQERAPSTDFAAFTSAAARAMSCRGLANAIKRKDELRRGFAVEEFDSAAMTNDCETFPFTFRRRERCWEIIAANLPPASTLASAISSQLPTSREALFARRESHALAL
jgi:hypothetical protein